MTLFEIGAVIQKMKGLPDAHGIRLPVRDEQLRIIGYLRGFDRFILQDEELIATMARCHTQYRGNFLTQFDVTPENKRSWLEKSVLNNDRKMLFLVETDLGRVVGQDGFSVGEDGIFSLDGTMRWARGGHTDLFIRNVLERAGICFGLLECRICQAEIFKSNVLAVDNMLSIGFKMEREHSLSVSERDGVISYTKQPDADLANTKETLIELSMNEASFRKLHGRIADNPSWRGIL